MKYLRLENGEEYTSLEFRRYCKKNGIKYYYTVKMTPQQNGIMDRMNQILIKKAQSLRL